MNTLVMKFGGSSIGTTPALTQVVSIVLQEHERRDRLIIVVAALEGVTDSLLEAARLAQLSNRRGYRRIAATIRTRHLSLIDQLPLGATERSALQADVDQLLFDMLDVCQSMANETDNTGFSDKTDAIISVGERLSARIVAALLRQNNIRGVAIDATEIIVTDNTHGHAMPNMTITADRIETILLPMLDRHIVPIVTGFIAGTVKGKPTTLGRGGSDYTASILGVCAHANEVWIWADVDGMMTADPKEHEGANAIPQLSYDEVAELAYFGARILHARMVDPLHTARIPLRIKNVFKPQQAGTLVRDVAAPSTDTLKAVTSIHGIALSIARSGPLTDIIARVDETLHNTVGSRADVMISAQSSSHSLLCFVIPTSAGPDAVHTMRLALQQRLPAESDTLIWEVMPVSIVTVIGEDIGMNPQIAAAILQQIVDVEVLALSQAPSRCGFSLVVRPQDAYNVVDSVHTLILNMQ